MNRLKASKFEEFEIAFFPGQSQPLQTPDDCESAAYDSSSNNAPNTLNLKTPKR
jgi:hypothetical protein